MAAKETDLALPRYRPSGSTRMVIIPMALAAIAAAVILGVIYAVVGDWIPFVMLTMLLVFGVGFAVGMIARLTCQFAHCRNRTLGLLLGIVCAITALASSFWFKFAMDKRAALKIVPAAERAEATRAITFNYWIEVRKESGWTVKGTQYNGGAVIAIWAFEALLILGFASVMGWQGGGEPYCEQCRAWPKSHKLSLKGRTPDEFWTTARAGSPLGVLQLPKTERADTSLVLESRICDKCGNGFLDVAHEVVATGKDGKEQTTRTPLIQSIILDQPNCHKFLAATHESVS